MLEPAEFKKMGVFWQELPLKTRERLELINITGLVEKVVEESNLDEGIALVFAPHTTAALLINEAESGLLEDFKNLFKDIVRWEESYKHNRVDSNAPSHLVGGLLSPSLSVPFNQKRLFLGTWQSIFFVELDGPRNRQVRVVLYGESKLPAVTGQLIKESD